MVLSCSFQLAMCLLIMILAFAAHMRALPYMGADETDAVLLDVAEKAKTDPLYAQLRLRALDADGAQRKPTRRNGLKAAMTSVAAASKFIGQGVYRDAFLRMLHPGSAGV